VRGTDEPPEGNPRPLGRGGGQKVAEECIKALAEVLRVPEAEEAWKSRRWCTWLLGSTARSIANEINKPEVVEAWAPVTKYMCGDFMKRSTSR